MLRSWLATWGSPLRGSSRSPDSYVADPNVKVLPYNPIRKSAPAANRPISTSRTKTHHFQRRPRDDVRSARSRRPLAAVWACRP